MRYIKKIEANALIASNTFNILDATIIGKENFEQPLPMESMKV